ncbi:hypothetical protein AMES_1010 [Amycolatopsis mediterranei S699]|uniref:Uncharacterized protein n=2 Tax=Amycolatopsis mediterranei TaxID=33910 RepID=A0A0H3CWZ0_AMYMU|nr:hypothetical protein [Amycolatopsis mediterranei]ADJ42833.1 hypothetical protein AMED_1015 [Amycolatopsis mediterranei U32]AEK39525.1 hypothetical protein RAM_05165 [Amycolatopsis mediterranei S699]AFO74546.1 hypothetical protein AMES_1010 [Amycolatopsis mediterranei S699]AGT81675.1 hypothetical protein B737_1011 [Amycolatopsis mediterranei RB]KDO10162.1 hypothetical protein DV26_14400 [Amycolatopsis mediterranei]
MDPRDRADALLARAQARGVFVVTPDSATSPMDSSNTQQIPRAQIDGLDRSQDPDTTTQLPASLIEENDHPLAGSAPTRRMEVQGGRRPQQTTPLSTPSPTTPLPMPKPTPLSRRPQAEQITSPLKEPDPEDTGLVPTVTQNIGKSDLSRRLDGI